MEVLNMRDSIKLVGIGMYNGILPFKNHLCLPYKTTHNNQRCATFLSLFFLCAQLDVGRQYLGRLEGLKHNKVMDLLTPVCGAMARREHWRGISGIPHYKDKCFELCEAM